MKCKRLAIVGATGAVGTRMIELVEEMQLAEEIVLFASERSVGKEINGRVIKSLHEKNIDGFDIAIFSAGATISRKWCPLFAESGSIVIDNSSCWRMNDQVPLVVSEVNPNEIKNAPLGIIANPNCTTMIAMLPLKALHDLYGLNNMVCTSFQAAGGAGQKGIDELFFQSEFLLDHGDELINGGEAADKVAASVHEDTLGFNVVPLLGTLDDNGYTDEEMKLQNESRKILSLPDLGVTPLCVRVPVAVGHSIAIKAQFNSPVDLDQAIKALQAFPNLEVQDLPSPLRLAGKNITAVGRIRKDLNDDHVLNFFVVGDNLLKGAALNSVQLAKIVIDNS